MVTTVITIYWIFVIVGAIYGYLKYKDDVERYPLNIFFILLFSLLQVTTISFFNDAIKDLYYYFWNKYITWKSLRKIKNYEDPYDNIGDIFD